MKSCNGCHIEKPWSDYYKVTKTGSPVGRCKSCISTETRDRYANDPVFHAKRVANAQKKRQRLTGAGLRAQRLPWQYGITVNEFDTMLDEQDGACAICGTTDPGGRGGQFHVDHDHACCPEAHSCGKCIRGLLCSRCNVGIGMLGDDIARITKALSYLTDYQALVSAIGAAV